METRSDQRARAESKAQLVEQINKALNSGDYSRALDLLRTRTAEFPNDVELSQLENRARDGAKRNAEAQGLITESQELFAQGKSVEAIQLLRKAYELDKSNSLARSILANALVEHANSIAETDWLEAEKLTNQALALNPAHPTAKTIFSLIVELKKTSSVEDWVSRARKLQSAGDLFTALAWVAEGLAVHPNDPKLLQIQDAIHRDQNARRRQARRQDLEELRRMELEVAAAVDDAAKQSLAERIQGVVAKYWTDGEILSVANGLLNRLGLAPEDTSATPRGKSAALIFHVPRASAPKPSQTDIPKQTSTSQAPTANIAAVIPSQIQLDGAKPSELAAAPEESKVDSQAASVPTPAPAVPAPEALPPAPVAKIATASARPEKRTNSRALIAISAGAIALVTATFFFTRRHYTAEVERSSPTSPNTSTFANSTPAAAIPTQPAAPVLAPSAATPAQASPQTSPRPSEPEPPTVSEPASTTTVSPENQPRTDLLRKTGALLVVADQDGATVFLNGKPQMQLTQAGQLLIPNLQVHNYAVQVFKSGFQNPPQQEVRIRGGEEARLMFNLRPQAQPQPRLAALTIQGGVPGTTVLVDQVPVGTIQPDGKLLVSTVNPGDHTVELRKAQFKPRQLKEHFVEGGAISLSAADSALETLPAELKINFAPPDAKVVLVKGNSLTIVGSGVPLNLAAGTYTLTARTADRFARSSTFEVIGGQSRTLDLSLAPAGMSKWDDPTGWKQEKDFFIRKGGDFVLYGAVPVSGTFIFSAMPAKGHVLQWVLNYTDPKNYLLFQIDDNSLYRAVIRNGEKTNEIRIPEKSDRKGYRTLRVRVSPAELVHEIKEEENWTVVDRWTQSGINFGAGKFGFYLPGNDQVDLSGFAYYPDLNLH